MNPTPTTQQAFRAQILYFHQQPSALNEHSGFHYYSDGLLLVENGVVQACGDYSNLAHLLKDDTPLTQFHDQLLMPGFIDSHIHFPQTEMIASPAPDLLPWLENYTFPTENRFSDPTHAAEISEFFLDELLRNGTTTAMVYGTSHKEATHAFFQASQQRNLRMIAGKVLMDRNCPAYLQDTAESGARDSEALLQHWHGTGRQLYALTPRFAPTSTPEQLGLCGELANAYPDVYIQSHVAESQAEVKWAAELFPNSRSYLDIYDQYGLLRPKAVYGHCIWLDEQDRARMRDTQSVAAHCPTSNLFLGSGLFDAAAADNSQMRYTLATDVGAGTSFSLLRTMDEAYKVARLQHHYLPALQLFYHCTAGAAEALGLAGKIGTLAPGAEADFIVVDTKATPLLARRSASANSLEELLFALALLGDDRCIYATYAAGTCVHQRGR